MADFDVTRMACGDFEVTLRQVDALERAVALALPHMAEQPRVDWQARAEAAEHALGKIVDAHAALVAAIQSAKGILESTAKAQR